MLQSKVLITAILLCLWLSPGASPREWGVVDLFAGEARIARMARQRGENACAMDINYHKDSHIFDVNSARGFVFLGFGHLEKLFSFCAKGPPHIYKDAQIYIGYSAQTSDLFEVCFPGIC